METERNSPKQQTQIILPISQGTPNEGFKQFLWEWYGSSIGIQVPLLGVPGISLDTNNKDSTGSLGAPEKKEKKTPKKTNNGWWFQN